MAPCGEVVPLKRNFRTAGRVSEKVRPTTLASGSTSNLERSKPSIPSRLETIIFQGDREFLGFGSNALRFVQNPGDLENPGPGSYAKLKSVVTDIGDRTSWGIRGTGTFASRSRRLGTRSMPSLPVYGRGCPGPGAYESTSAYFNAKEPKYFNHAKQTAIFTKPLPLDVFWKVPVPGPGHYKLPAKQPDAPQQSGAVASFRSCAQRGGGVQLDGIGKDTPGPGKYADGAHLRRSKCLGDSSPVFKEPSQRHFVPVHRDLPAADEQMRRVLGDFSELLAQECLGSNSEKVKATLPGPGHYDQDRDAVLEGMNLSSIGSSSFQHGSERTEWTSPDARLMPGPGRYEVKVARLDRLTSAASAFNSLSDRDAFPLKKGPGPCYYSPPPPKAGRSFHMNAKKHWV